MDEYVTTSVTSVVSVTHDVTPAVCATGCARFDVHCNCCLCRSPCCIDWYCSCCVALEATNRDAVRNISDTIHFDNPTNCFRPTTLFSWKPSWQTTYLVMESDNSDIRRRCLWCLCPPQMYLFISPPAVPPTQPPPPPSPLSPPPHSLFHCRRYCHCHRNPALFTSHTSLSCVKWWIFFCDADCKICI
jgi:hypothetical protein